MLCRHPVEPIISSRTNVRYRSASEAIPTTRDDVPRARSLDRSGESSTAGLEGDRRGVACKTQTVTDGLPLTIEADNTYSIRLNVAPGDSIYGVTVGYLPPTQGFVPFAGANPRVYDCRPVGKLADAEERLIPLGLAGARGAVVNLTLTRTVGTSGYVAVFAGNIAWPGNSSQNWYEAGANVANCVVTAVDSQGRIKIRGGENLTDVIIDVIGALY